MKKHSLHLACLGLTVTLFACTGVTPAPEVAELEVQAQRTQKLEPEAKHSIDDPEAQGGEAAILYSTDQKATFKLEVPSGIYRVSVRARADEYEGWPVMRLYHNAQPLGEDTSVKRETYGEGAQKFDEAELKRA